MSNTLGVVAGALISIAYSLIAATIVVPLVRTRQWKNHLAWMTAAIFFSCALGHAIHVHHALFHGVEMDWHLASWDVVTAVVAAVYLVNRRRLSALTDAPAMFEDMQAHRRQAITINDAVAQALIAAKLAYENDERAMGDALLEQGLHAARGVVDELVGAVGPGAAGGGSFRL